jgi:hypothetical protein
MMNRNNQPLLFKTLCFYELMFYFIFAEMKLTP